MRELTDLEICQRIAEIEGIQNQVEQSDTIHPYIYSEELNAEYDPLTDAALCFNLMIKYKVWRWSNPTKEKFNACIKNVAGWVPAETLNKAICLAIIASKTEA